MCHFGPVAVLTGLSIRTRSVVNLTVLLSVGGECRVHHIIVRQFFRRFFGPGFRTLRYFFARAMSWSDQSLTLTP